MDYDLQKEQERRDHDRRIETENRMYEISQSDDPEGVVFVYFLFVVGALIIMVCVGGM